MVTNGAQQQSIAPSTHGWLTRTGQQVRQFICGLHGHDALLHFERGRMSLLCSSCGHDSPGWDIKAVQARPDAVKAPARLLRMPFVGQRRVA